MEIEILYTSGDTEIFSSIKSVKCDKNGDLTIKFNNSNLNKTIIISAEKILDFTVITKRRFRKF